MFSKKTDRSIHALNSFYRQMNMGHFNVLYIYKTLIFFIYTKIPNKTDGLEIYDVQIPCKFLIIRKKKQSSFDACYQSN